MIIQTSIQYRLPFFIEIEILLPNLYKICNNVVKEA